MKINESCHSKTHVFESINSRPKLKYKLRCKRKSVFKNYSQKSYIWRLPKIRMTQIGVKIFEWTIQTSAAYHLKNKKKHNNPFENTTITYTLVSADNQCQSRPGLMSQRTGKCRPSYPPTPRYPRSFFTIRKNISTPFRFFSRRTECPFLPDLFASFLLFSFALYFRGAFGRVADH